MDVRRSWVFAVAMVAALDALTPQPAIAVPVSAEATGMRDLGTLGGPNSYAAAINALGQVAGTAETSTGYAHAFRWTTTRGMQDLGTLAGGNSAGLAMNELGYVVGVSYFEIPDVGEDVDPHHAFRWTPSGGMRDLGTLDGGATAPTAINIRGQVVGSSYLANGYRHAFLWTPSGDIRDLGTLGGPSSIATGINDLGQVTGSADTAEGTTHAFRWTPTGGMQDLGTLGGSYSEGLAINVSGQVIGNSYPDRGRREGYIWSSSRGMRSLPFHPSAINTLGQVVGEVTGEEVDFAVRWTASGGEQFVGDPRGRFSAAYAINDLGHVVGAYSILGPDPHAFRWTTSTGLKDLGTLGGESSSASAINLRGQVTGSADTVNDSVHAFLWNP